VDSPDPCPAGSTELLRTAAVPEPLAAFLKRIDTLGPSEWLAAVRADLETRWQNGERVRPETYLEHRPLFWMDADSVADLLRHEIAVRAALGESPRFEEYLQRFPNQQAQLQALFTPSGALAPTAPTAPARGGAEAAPSVSGPRTEWLPGEQARPLPHANYLPSVIFSGPQAAPLPAPEKPPLPDVPGYEVLEELGRGGMGVVYKARQRGLNRLVALKMIHGGSFADTENLGRFHLEAEAVARMQHPNIVQIFEIGTQHSPLGTGYSCPFFSLEYVDGGSLAQKTAGSPQPPRQAAELVETLALAMHYAHERGIVHRDLKPANVLLTRDGQPKISDFGLAKQLDPEAGATHTVTGTLVGTPEYMAPEQATSRAAVGPATDIHALGVVLYELLTGRRPFEGATPWETMELVREHEPVSPRALQPRVPRDLETVCLKCLRKETHHRYGSARELAADLRRYLAGEPILARPMGSVTRVWRWTRRRPAVAALLACLVVVVVVGIGGIVWQWGAAVMARDEAVAARQEEAHHRLLAQEAQGRAEAALYHSRMSQAALQWQANNFAQTQTALQRCVPAEGEPDLRGWEWRHFQGACNAELFTLSGTRPGDVNWVWGVAFSPDGRYLASAAGVANYLDLNEGLPGVWRLWDLTAGFPQTNPEPVQSMPGTAHGLHGFHVLAFSPDGRLLAMGGGDVIAEYRLTREGKQPDHGQVTLWEPLDGKLLRDWRIPGGLVRHLAFSPDGRYLAAANGDRLVLSDLHNPAAERVLPQAFPPLAFAPDGRQLAAFGPKGVLTVWDVARAVPVKTLTEEGEPRPHRLAFSPDGRRLAADGANHTIRLWQVATAQELPALAGHTAEVSAVTFAPDGATLASAGNDGTVRLWDVPGGRQMWTYVGHPTPVECVAFSPDGRRLASADHRGLVKVWDATRDPRVLQLDGGYYPDALTFLPDSQHLVSVNLFGQVRLAHVATRTLVRQVAVDRSADFRCPFAEAVFSPDGGRLAVVSGREPQVVKVVDPATGRESQVLRGHSALVSSLGFSGDGKLLASSAWDRPGTPAELKLWDVETGKALRGWPGPVLPVRCLAFSPDDRLLVAAAQEPEQVESIPVLDPKALKARRWDRKFYKSELSVVRGWDTATGEELFRLRASRGMIAALGFSPDGKYLAAADEAQALVQVWEAATRRPVVELQAPTRPTGLAFNPDGSRLAVVGMEPLVKLWDSASWEEVGTLAGFTEPRPSDISFNARIAFSPDGKHLAANDHTHHIVVWDGEESGPDNQAARRRTAAEAAVAWHLRRAEEFTERRQAFAALFHIDRVLAREPDNDAALFARGRLRAVAGAWEQAQADFARLAGGPPGRHAPHDPAVWFAQAQARLRLGDLAGYRELCGRMLERFDGSPDLTYLHWLVRACVLAPGGPDPARVLRAAQKARASRWRSSDTLCILAAAHYRAGQYREAAARSEEMLAAGEPPGKGHKVLAWLVLALAHQRLNQPAEARKWLGQADAELERQRPAPGAAPAEELTHALDWGDFLICRFWQREADALLKGGNP
jgi:WD40 repeat protein/tetratricopeptide (TPR) repeat protein